MAEVFAGFLSYTDAQIGRILDYLEESAQLDDTIIEERSLVMRQALDARIVWRERFTRR